MPRYFFHPCSCDRVLQDATGLELPEITSPDDPELTLALWAEAFEKHLRISQAFVVTDAVGRVVFLTAQ